MAKSWCGASKYHKTLYGFKLAQERESRAINQWQFAKECQWSQQYQAQLEGGEEYEVRIKIIDTIEAALDRFTEIPERESLISH